MKTAWLTGVVLLGSFLIPSASQAKSLTRAALGGNDAEVTALLDKGADVNKPDWNYQMTPLSAAALKGNASTVRLLLSRGANIDGRDINGNTPLIMAARNSQAVIVAILLDAGADPDLVDHEGRTALAWAEKNGGAESAKARVAIEKRREALPRERAAAAMKARCPVSAELEARRGEDEAAFKAALSASREDALPEEAHKFEVQANAAVKKEDFKTAAQRYAQGLAVAPGWPEGRYNYALILGKLSCNEDAILQMKRYLQLAPKARDSRKAQDKIYEWEGEMEGGAQ